MRVSVKGVGGSVSGLILSRVILFPTPGSREFPSVDRLSVLFPPFTKRVAAGVVDMWSTRSEAEGCPHIHNSLPSPVSWPVAFPPSSLFRSWWTGDRLRAKGDEAPVGCFIFVFPEDAQGRLPWHALLTPSRRLLCPRGGYSDTTWPEKTQPRQSSNTLFSPIPLHRL